MSDREYELLDALYFTVSIEYLVKTLETEEKVLVEELLALIDKGWVKCLEKNTEKEIDSTSQIRAHYADYNFLASKKGLLAHNSR